MELDTLVTMAKRLHVLLDEAEYVEIREAAAREPLSVAGWVRQSLRQARSEQAGGVEAKLRALADAASHEYPTGDIEEMLDDIEAGQRVS